MRRGIDPSDMSAVRQMVMGGSGRIYGGVEDDRSANHPSQQVPRFGSDLGFSQRGVQVCCPAQGAMQLHADLPQGPLLRVMQIAKKISKLILPDDLSVHIEHKSWHGKQPTTLTAVTLYIATQLGSRVMSPGVPVRTISEVRALCYCHISAPGMWSGQADSMGKSGLLDRFASAELALAGCRCLRGVSGNCGGDVC